MGKWPPPSVTFPAQSPVEVPKAQSILSTVRKPPPANQKMPPAEQIKTPRNYFPLTKEAMKWQADAYVRKLSIYFREYYECSQILELTAVL